MSGPVFIKNLGVSTIKVLLTASAISVLLSCAQPSQMKEKDITREIGNNGLILPKPLREKNKGKDENTVLLEAQQASARAQRATSFDATPILPPRSTSVTGAAVKDQFEALTGEPVEVNVNGLALSAFIDEVFGNILHQSYEIDSALQQKADLVTLRIDGALPPAQIAHMALKVLSRYGVEVTTEGSLQRFSVSANPQQNGSNETPLLISGTALPDVPVSHRTVFQFVPVKIVDARYAQRWLMQAYEGIGVKIDFDADANALVFMGAQPKVQQLVEALKLFDQPSLQGRHSTFISPVYISVKELEEQLNKILEAQGYKVSRGARGGSVILIPLESAHRLIAFAGDQQVLSQIKAWAAELDHAPQSADAAGLFIYKMQNIQAAEAVQVLNQLYGGSSGSGGQEQSVEDKKAGNSGMGVFRENVARTSNSSNDSVTSGGSGGNTFVVDAARNSLIYRGAAADWAQLLLIIKEMDVPPKQVLIQVIIAEISLKDESAMGVEGVLRDIQLGGSSFTGNLTSVGKLPSAKASGTFTLIDNAGAVRATLNAYASESRARFISMPSVLVKSGSSATVNVSTQFSVVTGESVSEEVTNGSSGSRQSYSYREAGTVLSVTPTIHADNRVELEISQDVSDQIDTDGTGNPSVQTRSVQTVLSLRDGGSVLLGGLIKTTRTNGSTQVPLLGKIPLLGALFRAKNDVKDRTELLIMVVPYVLNDSDEAEDITEQFRKRLSIEDRDSEPSAE